MARSVIAMVACLLVLGMFACAARAGAPVTPQGSEHTHAPRRFDIDAQPLAQALRRFGEDSGVAVLFDEALVAQRTSPGVHGDLEPREALDVLLAGTGLDARFSSVNAFTVVAAGVPGTSMPSMSGARIELDERAAADVQRTIERVLCAHAASRPGHYRLALQLWTDDEGVVSRVSLLGGSGDTGRDGDVAASLTGTGLPGMTRRRSPLTVLLRPVDRDPCDGEG